jgi:prepilin-type N-terminal cleavage/methylation domain-containing protein/prepilin-type processing-associated H-X9-DG protein
MNALLDEHRTRPRPGWHTISGRRAFTLIELLVVVAIISLLVSILLPALSAARQRARALKCMSNLHVLGQGMAIYTADNRDVMPPGRLPKDPQNDCAQYAMIYGRAKYRPTFLAMMSGAVGAPPFADPKACKNDLPDMFGEPPDRQNYSYDLYVCPSVPDWTDERNGSYGYNYQFLGNSRRLNESDQTSYKNWPVQLSWIRHPGRTVCVADSMGTAASWPPMARLPYQNNGRNAQQLGDEGFNLDPARVDPANGEMASAPDHRSAADPRHRGQAGVLWLDGHVTRETLPQLGYQVNPDGSVGLDGDNTRWSGSGLDVAWTPDFTP